MHQQTLEQEVQLLRIMARPHAQPQVKLTRYDSPSRLALRFGGRLTDVHGQCMLPMGANRMLVPAEMGGSVAE